ncbi:MAG TPA: DUF4262 domain-containing protein [Acidobacteriaceae bacterium]|nr:DUF4262 domain-containing protein [Acidobacteriaceae bacterium]
MRPAGALAGSLSIEQQVARIETSEECRRSLTIPASRAAEEKCIADVEKYGLHVVNVMADDEGPGFAYSVGLYRSFHHPEDIVVGLRREVMHDVLNDAATRVRSGQRYEAGALSDEFLEGFACTFRAVQGRLYDAYLGLANWFNEWTSYPAVQLVYPDREHRWPWDAEASEAFRRNQPDLATADVPDWARDAGKRIVAADDVH